MKAQHPYSTHEKVCPWCGETVKAAAIKCRFCGSNLTKKPGEKNQLVYGLLWLFFGIYGIGIHNLYAEQLTAAILRPIFCVWTGFFIISENIVFSGIAIVLYIIILLDDLFLGPVSAESRKFHDLFALAAYILLTISGIVYATYII